MTDAPTKNAVVDAATGEILFVTDGIVDPDSVAEGAGTPIKIVPCDNIEGDVDSTIHHAPGDVIELKPQADLDAALTARLNREARQKRKKLLIASDWTQVSDAPTDKAAWADYRQALRDITDQPGYPHNIVWPEAPT